MPKLELQPYESSLSPDYLVHLLILNIWTFIGASIKSDADPTIPDNDYISGTYAGHPEPSSSQFII